MRNICVQQNVRKTILFVSHDIAEAFKLGTQIVVMNDGKLVQLGTPVELLTNPANAMVSQLVGADNILRELEYQSTLELDSRTVDISAVTMIFGWPAHAVYSACVISTILSSVYPR